MTGLVMAPAPSARKARSGTFGIPFLGTPRGWGIEAPRCPETTPNGARCDLPAGHAGPHEIVVGTEYGPIIVAWEVW